MFRAASMMIAFACVALLPACGGSGDGTPPAAAVPPPPPAAELALDAQNYRVAMQHALEWADSAFSYAKLGADVADRLLNLPLNVPPRFACAIAGAASVSLSDRNGNYMLNEGDTISLFMDACVTSTVTASGVVRVEVISAAPLGDGRDLELLVHLVDLTLTSNSPADAGPETVNLSCSLDFSYTTDFDRYVLSFCEYRRTLAGQTRFATDLLIDYLQRYDTQSYDYLLQGTLASSATAGQFRVTTPLSFSGTLGAFPNAGQLGLRGAANSTARLSEEGAAAVNNAAVLVSVDTNGDGAADSEVAELDWMQISRPEMFSSLRGRHRPGLLPVP
jgi:hypothetical protein